MSRVSLVASICRTVGCCGCWALVVAGQWRSNGAEVTDVGSPKGSEADTATIEARRAAEVAQAEARVAADVG